LRPLSLVRAKAALPVAGQPLVNRILRWLASQGIHNVVLNLHYLPHTITAIVGEGSDTGLQVRYSWEPVLLGPAGGPRQALPLLLEPRTPNPEPRTPNSEPRTPNPEPRTPSDFLIVNGDTLTDMDLSPILADHRASGALVTLAVVPNTEPEKYGGVLVGEGDVVKGFVPRGGASGSFHFIGVQVASGDAFRDVPPSTPCESFGDLYPRLIAGRPGSVRAFHAAARFDDIGTPADYLATSLRLSSREGATPAAGDRTRIEAGSVVERSILWDDVLVDANVVVRDSVVTDGVHVPAGTSWNRQTIRRHDGVLAPGERLVGDLAVAPL
jgi:NDP-sugar pyrophosphorylase family protein